MKRGRCRLHARQGVQTVRNLRVAQAQAARRQWILKGTVSGDRGLRWLNPLEAHM